MAGAENGRNSGALGKEDAQRLDALFTELTEAASRSLGYQVNQKFDYSDLGRFLKFSLNNAGDPFVGMTYAINTKKFEREVLEFFAGLMNIGRGDFWGYVTHGGTAGNMYGLYIAREKHPEGTVYFSADSHYSVAKSTDVLRMDDCIVESLPNGEIDYSDLEKKMLAHPNSAPIVVANIGTTMTGAVDRVERIAGIIEKLGFQESYIHCDAALGGMLLPFLKGSPPFDFRLPISSMSISGHKMIGSPIPCGIVLIRKGYMERIKRHVEYIGSYDNTLSGSRNGLSPLIMWHAIKRLGMDGFEKLAGESREMAEYALGKLQGIGWNAWLNPNANVVVFDRPSDRLARKWQIAVHGSIAHIYTMGHVTRDMIDGFAGELAEETSQNIRPIADQEGIKEGNQEPK